MVVRITLDAEGVPMAMEPMEGPPILVGELLKVLPQWRFEPPRSYRLQPPVAFPMAFRFDLKPSSGPERNLPQGTLKDYGHI